MDALSDYAFYQRGLRFAGEQEQGLGPTPAEVVGQRAQHRDIDLGHSEHQHVPPYPTRHVADCTEELLQRDVAIRLEEAEACAALLNQPRQLSVNATRFDVRHVVFFFVLATKVVIFEIRMGLNLKERVSNC